MDAVGYRFKQQSRILLLGKHIQTSKGVQCEIVHWINFNLTQKPALDSDTVMVKDSYTILKIGTEALKPT